MSGKSAWRAGAGAMAALLTFVLIVVLVDRFEDYLSKINWALVTIMCGFAAAAVAVYRWNRWGPKGYNLVDLVRNPKTNRADPYRHLLFVFAGLGAWAVIQVVLAKRWENLTPLLAMLLGYFVLKPTVDHVSDAFGKRVPDQDTAAMTDAAEAATDADAIANPDAPKPVPPKPKVTPKVAA